MMSYLNYYLEHVFKHNMIKILPSNLSSKLTSVIPIKKRRVRFDPIVQILCIVSKEDQDQRCLQTVMIEYDEMKLSRSKSEYVCIHGNLDGFEIEYKRQQRIQLIEEKEFENKIIDTDDEFDNFTYSSESSIETLSGDLSGLILETDDFDYPINNIEFEPEELDETDNLLFFYFLKK